MEQQGESFVCSICSGLPALSIFAPVKHHNFAWSPSVSGDIFSERVCRAYDIVVHWRRNLFPVPSGRVGTQLVSELSKLFNYYGRASALESIALRAAMLMPALLL